MSEEQKIGTFSLRTRRKSTQANSLTNIRYYDLNVKLLLQVWFSVDKNDSDNDANVNNTTIT